MTPERFGAWAAADGVAHYFLGGRPLCGRPCVPTDQPVRALFGTQPTGAIIVPHCRACCELNIQRWAAVGSPAPEGAAHV